MKKKCKILFSFLIILSVLVGTGAPVAYAEETHEVSFVDQYWNQISEALLMEHDESFVDELEENGIFYQFQDNMRVRKIVGDKIIDYIYNAEEDRMEEICENISTIYQYDEQGILDTVTYDNSVYYAETADDGSVVKLINANNECVVNYAYSNGDVTIFTESRGGNL